MKERKEERCSVCKNESVNYLVFDGRYVICFECIIEFISKVRDIDIEKIINNPIVGIFLGGRKC